MKSKIFIIIAFLSLNTLCLIKDVEAKVENNNTQIYFSFFNSETGYAVKPDHIIIYKSSSNIIVKSICKDDFENATKICVDLESGHYQFMISAAGYLDFTSSLYVIENKKIQNNIFLEPYLKNPKLEPNRIQLKHKSDYTLVMGFIVDEVSGMPISGVKVTSSLSNEVSYSDINGYYELYVPSLSCNINEYGNIYFNTTGYSKISYKNLELFSNDDVILNVKLRIGKSEMIVDMRKYRRRFHEKAVEKADCKDCQSDAESYINQADIKHYNNLPSTSNLLDAVVIPANIRVGRNCTGTNCTTVEYYTLETYCKYVLPAEIYGCWGGLTGGLNSLQAFSVAVRSYGLWYVYNPLSSTYDICDNTYCQVFGSIQNTYCNTAVDNTSRYILVNGSGNIMKTEYSAENNNKGCGNGYCGTGTTWPCIYDPVCLNENPNGHGRGLCQWGSIRWATGTKVSTSSPCNLGPSHSYGTKTWQGILSHYYPSYTLTQGGTASINSAMPNPSNVNPCSTFVIQYNVTSTSSMSLMFAASIRKSGTSNWISDPTHDVKYSLTVGTNNYSRSFTVPCSTPIGSYDLLVAMWFDKNYNNIIDQGDFVVNAYPVIYNALNIQNLSGITKLINKIPEKFDIYQNYPNPFNPITTIKFDLPINSDIKIIIYDLKGSLINSVSEYDLYPGQYSYHFDGSNLSSGIYFCRLISNEYQKTIKLNLMK